MPSFRATQEQQFDDGIYRAKLVEMEDAEGGVDDKGYVKWTFELMDEEYTGQSLRANSSLNFGPRAKARGWAEALLGRRIESGEEIGEEDLVGCVADLMVKNAETENGVFARVESVNPVRKKKQKPAAQEEKKPEPEEADDSEEWEDIPF